MPEQQGYLHKERIANICIASSMCLRRSMESLQGGKGSIKVVWESGLTLEQQIIAGRQAIQKTLQAVWEGGVDFGRVIMDVYNGWLQGKDVAAKC